MTPLITAWAARWGIDPHAIAELRAALLGLDASVSLLEGKSESHVQSKLRLEAASKGIRLWRNNVGVLTDERGVPVRYGLANDSSKVNESLKSGDLIGIRPLLIQPQHVGHTIGQFVSREVKAGDWKWSGTKREVAQANWAMLVNTMGGDAQFARGEGTL